jgi:hypothetical protein
MGGGVLLQNRRKSGLVTQEVALQDEKKFRTQINSVARVLERNIPTERPLLVGEVSVIFC